MKDIKQNDIKALFSRLCCSRCKNEFTIESIKILDRGCNIMHCSLSCAKCGKDFGEILLNFNPLANYHSPLEILSGPPAITHDDVIDAHNFIKKLK